MAQSYILVGKRINSCGLTNVNIINQSIKTQKEMIKNLIGCLLLLLSITSCGPDTAEEQSALIEIENGQIQGTLENGLALYKGIPFAAPPVGDLRWRPPQPVESWNGVLDADQFVPACMQNGNPPSGTSEDCLYLNIWSPARSADEEIPVLVWIYGGGFNAGATSHPNTNGEMLAEKGVVLVSIAYRVGRLGFLAHPELSAESPQQVSGNYGLLDMIAALEWIQENISAFGGDPDKVTIFGESAGGIAVSMLAASPLAEGLFHGAVSQSGGSFGPHRTTTYPGENMKRLDLAEQNGESYVQSAGVSSIGEMREIDAGNLPPGTGLAWPIVDGWVIPDDQFKLYEEGEYIDVPILVGYNSDEGLSFFSPETPEAYIESVKERYGPFADDLIEAYPVGTNSIPKTARDLMRDAAFGWHTWSWARLQAETGTSKVFYYYFDQHPDYPEDSPMAGYGSPHGQDVSYVFEQLDPSDPDITETDLEISDAMGTYWTNFAKYGDPNGEGVPEWPEFTNDSPVVMHFNQTPHPGSVPSQQSLEVLDDYFQWRRTPEGEAWAD